jgi:phage gp29-like protein
MWEKVDSYVLPTRVEAKPQEWFLFDAENNLKLRTKDSPIFGESLPEYKFLLIQHNATYQNPYGDPALSKCFWPVTFKRGGMKFWAIFAEKYGMPYLIGKHPRGTSKEETEKLADLLESMIQDAVAVIPDDSSVEIMEPGGKSASSQIYRDLLEYCDQEITISLLGQNLTTQVEKGSYAAAQVHMQVRKDLLDSDKRLIENIFNSLIKWIYEINFSEGETPYFTLYEEEEVEKDLAERDEKLANVLQISGLKLSKKYFQKAYGLEDEDFEQQQTPTSKQLSQQFYEQPSSKNTFPDQQAIDDAINALSDEELQKQMEGVLKPIIQLIQGGNSYEEIMEKLVETFPDMDQNALEEMLSRAIFVSELWGMLNARRS